MKKIGSVLVTCLLAAVAWIACGLILADYTVARFTYWAGFGFGLAIIVAVCTANYLLKAGNRATVEVNALPIVISFAYIFMGLSFNAYFMFQPIAAAYGRLLSAVNVVFLVVYILFVFFSAHNTERISGQVELTAAKTANTTEIASLVARLLSQASDDDIKKKLHAFKEKIDYSNNISQDFTEENEMKLMDKLRDLGTELSDGTSKEQIISDIEAAEQIWEMRNAKVSTIR